MSDTVLVSTHDLERAGALREAFREEGYRVELITPSEDLSDQEEAVLLVLSGGLRSDSANRLSRQARESLQVPVLGVGGEPEEPGWQLESRLGLSELFREPVDPDEVLLVGRRIIERRRLQELTGIVGETDAIREALERVVQIAPVASTVLITGESGTGKELVARGIHGLSPRKHRPFIAVNVAALPDTLLESELFGHEKGAFTGAIDSRKGLFELAHTGTIFLDEIGEMPLPTQTKLLRVLEEREFLRVGGEKPTRVDVRVIAATNQDLRRLVATGDFRRDLYYRLNVLRIELPPLRNRREDIPLLVNAFVREVSERHDRSFPGISDEAMEILKEHHWPGNVRELRNLVESMAVLAPNRVIQPADIPEEVRSPGRSRSLLPVPRPDPPERRDEGGAPSVRPELEFIFRTLVELRVDMDELRREFEAYRRDRSGERPVVRRLRLPSGGEMEIRVGRDDSVTVGEPGEDLAGGTDGPSHPAEEPEDGDGEGEGVVVFRPGMTMDEMEREAIVAALRQVDGNRRRAAEELGIGERTLYRKIRRYGIEE